MLPELLLTAFVGSSHAAPAAWIEDYFAVDPRRESRPSVVGHSEVLAACAGVRALRDAALECPLDHQTALRGLPALAEVCAQTDGGRSPPGEAFPVPHPVTLTAAARAAAAVATRLGTSCGYRLKAVMVGNELQVQAPIGSGAVELRIGWHPSEFDTVRWLRPLHGELPAEDIVTRTIPLGEVPERDGRRSFDLSVEVLDQDGAATRVRMPIEIVGPDTVPSLGPILEVAVGTAEGVTPLADLSLPESTDELLQSAVPRPILPDPLDLVGRPSAGAGQSRAGLRAAASSCGNPQLPTRSLAPRLCAWFTTPQGEARKPSVVEGPVLAAAARDDLVSFARNLGEVMLYTELSRTTANESWLRLDGAAALAAVGGMVEAMLRGTPPRAAAAGWSRQRPPALPDGRRMGFYAADGVVAAPVSALLYLSSLLLASGPEDQVELAGLTMAALPTAPAVRPDAPLGATAIAIAANLSREENLPAGVSVAWTGALRPMAGAAELGWLRSMASRILARVAAASADNAGLSAIPGDSRAAARASQGGLRLSEAIRDGVVLAGTIPANDIASSASPHPAVVDTLGRLGGALVARLGGGEPASAAAEASRAVVGVELGERFVAPPDGTFEVAALLASLSADR